LKRLGIKSLAGIPLVVEGKVTGVLRLGMRESGRFNAGHIRLLELVADRVALALAQSRLFEAERRARESAERAQERVSRLQAVTASLASAWTPQQAIEVVLKELRQSLRALAAGVAIVREDGGFELLGAQGLNDSQLHGLRNLPAGIARPLSEVVANGSPLFFENQADFRARYPGFVERIAEIGGSCACLPLGLARTGARPRFQRRAGVPRKTASSDGGAGSASGVDADAAL
jgi:GAF domain-containing protein